MENKKTSDEEIEFLVNKANILNFKIYDIFIKRKDYHKIGQQFKYFQGKNDQVNE